MFFFRNLRAFSRQIQAAAQPKCQKATLINGKHVAERILNELQTELAGWKEENRKAPHLSAILVGEDPASSTYVKNKMKAAKIVGIETKTLHFPSTIEEKELVENIKRLNESNTNGILVQLPLPKRMNCKEICDVVAPEKDVDGFTSVNFGKFCSGQETFIPCTALAVCQLLRETGLNLKGKNAVVCGRSKHVGLPISIMLHGEGKAGLEATTTICHCNTPREELEYFCRSADIIISATGIPNLIRGHMIKDGAVVIDVGISRLVDEEGRLYLVGDVNFEEVKNVASFLTPVPGGVGPMTCAMLMKNTVQAAKSSYN